MVQPGTGIELPVERSVQVHAGKVAAVDAVIAHEVTANEDAAIGLEREGAHLFIGAARQGGKGKIQAAIGVEARQAIASDRIGDGESTAGDNGAVGLQADGIDSPVEGRREIGVGPTGRHVKSIAHDAEQGGGRGAQDSCRHWIRQLQHDRAVGQIKVVVINEWDGEDFADFAGAESQGAVGGDEFDARSGVEAGAGVEVCAERADAAPLAHDRDNSKAAVFVLDIGRAAER